MFACLSLPHSLVRLSIHTVFPIEFSFDANRCCLLFTPTVIVDEFDNLFERFDKKKILKYSHVIVVVSQQSPLIHCGMTR